MEDKDSGRDSPELQIRFWGVRGSIPCPGSEYLRYGGNTPCVEISYGNEGVVIDAGSGIRQLGAALDRSGKVFDKRVIFTHYHWDHIQGLPFFGPLYRSDPPLLLGSTIPDTELRRTLDGQMVSPYFPATMELPPGIQCFYIPPEGSQIGPLHVRPFTLHHPDPTFGYRIETPAGVIIHACDFEHGSIGHDILLRETARDADLMVYDAHFAPEEFDAHRGWGHSTWAEGVKVARDAGVKRLALFHHHPDRDDDALDKLAADAKAEFPGAFAAREGQIVTI